MNKLITELAKLAKVTDIEAFAKALQSEGDTDFQLDTESLIVRTKAEDEEFKTNISTEIKNKAFNDAFEIQIKNMKKDLGLEFEGKKQEDFINAFKTKVLNEANIEPSKRISELESTLTKINKTLQDKDSELLNLKSSFQKEKVRLETETYLNVPETLGLSKQEATDLFLMKYEIKDDGIYKGDERIVDPKTAKPLALKDVVDNFVTERGWNKEVIVGRGGQGNKGNVNVGVPTTLAEFDEMAKGKGFNVGSKDYNAYLAEIVKENPEIIN